MKEKYEKPEMTITEYSQEDIILTSALTSGKVDTSNNDGWVPGWY